VRVHLDSPRLPPIMLESPSVEKVLVKYKREYFGLQINTNSRVHAIDQFGTNTFDIHAWMASPTLSVASTTSFSNTLPIHVTQPTLVIHAMSHI